ncbi:hypothetical protein H632_c4705p0, partial [Helicosporidium sp. ATCC 50920]
ASRDGARPCYYSSIPRLVKLARMSSEERTAANMDRSAQLQALVEGPLGGNALQLVGELQFAFLAFLQGHSPQGFAQWKAILGLCFGCLEAPLAALPRFFECLLRALDSQLAFLQGEVGPAENLGQASAGEHILPGVAAEDLLQDSFFASAAKQ